MPRTPGGGLPHREGRGLRGGGRRLRAEAIREAPKAGRPCQSRRSPSPYFTAWRVDIKETPKMAYMVSQDVQVGPAEALCLGPGY